MNHNLSRQEQVYAKHMLQAHPEVVSLERRLAALSDAELRSMLAKTIASASLNPGEPVRVIGSMVAAYYGVTWDDLRSPNRSRKAAYPRQMAMYMARELTRRSLPDIGRRFCRDHTTVLHAMRAVKARMAQFPDVAEDIERFRSMFAAKRNEAA